MIVKPTGKDIETVPEQQEKQKAAEKIDPAAVPETDALLKELEEMLEITKKAPETKPEQTDGQEKPAEADRPAELEKAAPSETESAAKEAPKTGANGRIDNVSYSSMAKAVEEAKKEPTNRFSRDAFDDETLLAELHALIGDPVRPKPAQSRPVTPAPVQSVKPNAPASRPVSRITPETLNNYPDDYDELMESDDSGVPGWVKGVFILLVSLLVGAMTLYAVASDVIGKIF